MITMKVLFMNEKKKNRTPTEHFIKLHFIAYLSKFYKKGKFTDTQKKIQI